MGTPGSHVTTKLFHGPVKLFKSKKMTRFWLVTSRLGYARKHRFETLEVLLTPADGVNCAYICLRDVTVLSQTPQRSSLPLPGLALSGAFFPSSAFPNQWTVKLSPGVKPTTPRGFISPDSAPIPRPAQPLPWVFITVMSLVMWSDCGTHSVRANNVMTPWGQSRGQGDKKHPSLPTFPTQVVSKRQPCCRAALGTSSLTGPREEGCRKINGQHPFTVMGFCLGQWASSSY